MKVREIMTKKVESVMPQTNLKEAASKMKELNVGILPVVEDNRVVGVLTDRDIAIRSTSAGADPNNITVRDVMSASIHFCHEEDNVRDVAKQLEKWQIHRMPVLDKNEMLAGIISVSDLANRGSRKLACEAFERISKAA